MHQPTANSSFINNPAAPGELTALVAPAKQGNTPSETPPPKPLPKPTMRKPPSLAKAASKEPDRCRHYTAKGRRCQLPVLNPTSGLCFRHVGRQFLGSGDEDLSPAFLGLLSGFQSASRIHAFLTQVTILLVQNRVSTRRAAVLTYLGQILLRTLPAIGEQEEAAKEAAKDAEPPGAGFGPWVQQMIEHKRRHAEEVWAKRRAEEADARTRNGDANSQPRDREGQPAT